MHLYVFWWHILLRQQDKHSTTQWAVQMGFLDQHVTSDLSMKRLYRIEILESILSAMEKGCLSEDSTKRLFFLCNQFDVDCVEEAMRWLEDTGEPEIASKVHKLGPKRQRVLALSFVFTEYVHYVHAMAFNKNDIIAHYASPACKCCVERSEGMKTKGNELFQKRKYDAAVRWYTRAIKFHPENHILYGNRALCFIRSEKYQKAIGDGKRATIIQPDWAKGHYRFCDALFFLGEHKRALEANKRAQELCCSDPEGMRDLQQQKARFLKEMEESRGGGKRKKVGVKKDLSKRVDSVPRTGPDSLHSTEHPGSRTAHVSDTSAEDHKEPGNGSGCGENPGATEGRTQTEGNSKDTNDIKREMAGKKSRKQEQCTSDIQKPKNRTPPAQEKMEASTGGADVKDPSATDGLRNQFKSAVQDAHTALSDQRCRNAEQAFSQALCLLGSTVPKDLGISDLDTVLLKYGRATALLETGQPEELAEAKEEFLGIQSVAGRTFQCLVYYGIGRVFLKENRFSAALEQFSDALLMVKRQITPGKLTWPTTKVIIEETQTDFLKDLLEKNIEMCKFPPKPDALCRNQKCQGHSKIEIYFTDPDFKGFIRMVCCQGCSVEFHISCWKKMKAALYSDKNDKDFLQETCFTPDCGGKICRIVIYGSTGLIKCEFEVSIQKPAISAKARVKQKCTSLKKLKSKEDRKFKRKQHRQAASPGAQQKTETESMENTEQSEVDHQEKASQAWLTYGDRVLHQIFENKELLKDGVEDISAFMKSLQPWMEVKREKGNEKYLHSLKEAQTMRDIVELLLDRKNRVWARVFIQTLSDTQDISPKLHDWAHRLDSAGLRAAETFIERHAEHLEEVDLAPLLTFTPMQDILIEKFGTTPEFFSEGSTVTDYLKQAPPREVRLFIWTMEENRDHYPSFHHVLNDYFDIMDSHCLVIKKSENENQINSSIKTKNRSRKKKQKEPKSLIILSGTRGGTLREEDEDIFSEEDSLMFLNPSDPFSVPNHLRDQVAEFEGQYVSIASGSHYRRILDNDPDPTKESLYDYFAQILEEHGPMEAHSQLLVGELENFPPEAKQKIEEAGGLKAFLLESLRFVMMDNLIGLMKHAVSLQEVAEDSISGLSYFPFPTAVEDISTRGPSLNPSAKEFQPLSKNHIPTDDNTSFPFGNHISHDMKEIPDPLQPSGFEFAEMPYNIFPDLYMLDPSSSSLHEPFAESLGEVYDGERTLLSDSPKPFLGAFHNPSKDSSSSNKDTDFTLKTEDADLYNTSLGGSRLLIGQHSRKRMTVAVQASAKPRDDVAVNTEPYEPFESNKGDMTKREKDNMDFEKQIKQMMENYKEEQQKRKEDISVLEGELEEIRQNTEVTNKELELFQQKLEEEVKKDQQEKKENQEALKVLKTEIKELTESHEIFSKNIKEKNKEYEKHLNDFLERSNQSAAEKMGLEEEIKRCRQVRAEAASRSQAAEISILENRRRQNLRGLYKCVSDWETIADKITELVTRFPSSGLRPAAEAWQACVQDTKEKIYRVEAQYMEQIELVKKGTRLCTLPQVSIPSASPPPPLPMMPMAPVISNPSMVQVMYPARPTRPHDPRQYMAPYGAPLPARHQLQHGGPRAPSVPAPVQAEPSLGKPGQQPDRAARMSSPVPPTASGASSVTVRPAGPQLHSNVFERIVDRLGSMFPHYSRPTLTKFIQEVRTANGGCLNSLSYEEVINRVAQLILDHQENTREQFSATHRADPSVFRAPVSRTPPPRADSPAVSRSSGTPPPSHVWKNVGAHNSSKWASSKALNVEDPCIICHEEMTEEELCVLECRHSFHRECIKSWLKEQSTCPTCREHALLPEDFPLLPGRMRRGHTPATPSS
ncbi:E3 ubiquitin-protein ligase TTC3 isoform X1 [Megalops cyprinoides]|uniref:E3 ubiquitin-protein ligase TTC3 isoform X1 n=2 Tax=Megalops cyprinoides TaxID=118141 RepID=UPI00186528A0|nr:E3 ubiquitin-protein ligase TTC3 isoform X1 [Megalops cyprinoides]